MKHRAVPRVSAIVGVVIITGIAVGSFGAGPLELHVGLGPATTVRQLIITWPDSARSRTSYTNLAVDRSYRVVQGSAPMAIDRKAVPFRKVKTSAPPEPMKH
jgi:hypothetical protein